MRIMRLTHSMNRQVALHNIQYICPPFATILINTYRKPSRLIILGGAEILSEEGSTQGDNLAMAFYGLNTRLLIDILKVRTQFVKQVWLADDATSARKIKDLKEWWDIIRKEGEKIGYYVNTSKSWIIIKDVTKLEDAKEQFGNSIKFTTDGKRHLGAIIGSQSFKNEYVNEKVEKWCQELERLIKIAETQPHTAYAAYIHGLQHKYTYFKRTIPNLEDYLHRLDELIT